jgi:hypothetical protein
LFQRFLELSHCLSIETTIECTKSIAAQVRRAASRLEAE